LRKKTTSYQCRKCGNQVDNVRKCPIPLPETSKLEENIKTSNEFEEMSEISRTTCSTMKKLTFSLQ